MTINQIEPPQFALGDMDMPCPPPDVLGDNFNIPLLVQEAGGRQLARMHARRSQLEQEIEKLNVDIAKLEQLVVVASSL